MAEVKITLRIKVHFWVKPFIALCAAVAYLLYLDEDDLAWVPDFVVKYGVSIR